VRQHFQANNVNRNFWKIYQKWTPQRRLSNN